MDGVWFGLCDLMMAMHEESRELMLVDPRQMDTSPLTSGALSPAGGVNGVNRSIW